LKKIDHSGFTGSTQSAPWFLTLFTAQLETSVHEQRFTHDDFILSLDEERFTSKIEEMAVRDSVPTSD
jgi:hypothetical protein